MARDAYGEIVAELRCRRPGEVVTVPKSRLTPRPSSWRRSIGFPHAGALVQWRDGVVHVHETRTHYHLHRDTVAAHEDLLGHLRADAPGVLRALVAGTAVLAAALVVKAATA